MLIREVIQQALTKGFLTAEAEKRLHLLLQTNDEIEDFDAFMTLQLAIITGRVRQESCGESKASV